MGLSRRQLPFIASSTFLLAGGVLFFAFPIRYIYQYCIVVEDNNGLYLALLSAGTVYMIIFYLFVVSTFFLSSFVDPGVYPRESTNEEDDFRQPLYRVINVNGIVVRMKWCETCKFYRPPRCSHCSICDCCVEKFDHHCPWVDNCIGNRNYKYFFLFVNSLSIFILTGFCWGALSVYLLAIQDELLYGIVDFVLMAVGVIAFIPVVGLAGFHCGLVCMGRTTNEHVTGKYRTTGNPFDMGCRRNCCFVLCATKKPRYINYVMKAYRTSRLRAVSHLPPPAEPTPLYEVVRDVGQPSAHNNAANAVQMPSPVSNGATSGNEAEHYEDAQMTEITV